MLAFVRACKGLDRLYERPFCGLGLLGARISQLIILQGDCSLRTCVCSSFNDWGCSVCSGVVVTIGAEADQRRRLNDSVCLQVINGANELKLLVVDRIRNRLVEWCVHEACNLAEAGFKIIGGQGAPVK